MDGMVIVDCSIYLDRANYDVYVHIVKQQHRAISYRYN